MNTSLSQVSQIFFDVDGTLYRKDVEYNPATGSLQIAHDFFRYSAHSQLKQSVPPSEVKARLVEEYFLMIRHGTLKERVAALSVEDKSEFEALVKKYGSNGNVFGEYHKLKELGQSNLLHEMLSNIDFSVTFQRDEKLVALVEQLKAKGYGLGVITSERYTKLKVVFPALGLNPQDFCFKYHPELLSSKGQFYPLLCRDNCISKPRLDGFIKAMRILELPQESFLYIGNRPAYDIVPALTMGWQAA
ncbi:MAG: HAD family hydrolase, partial [Nanoarchaeota archaeon]